MPCSDSRTKRSPTPAFSEGSTCISLYFLRTSFTNCAVVVFATMLHQLLCTSSTNVYTKCLLWVHIQGISLCTATSLQSHFTLSVANIGNKSHYPPFRRYIFSEKSLDFASIFSRISNPILSSSSILSRNRISSIRKM